MNGIFFSNNLDYVELFNGASFFLLGVSCILFYLRHGRASRSASGWLLLGCFSFALCLYKGLMIVADELMRPELWHIERNLLLAAGFICLFEFGALHARPRARLPLHVFVLVPLVFCVALIAFFTRSRCVCEVVIRHFLGLPAAVLTGFVFWSTAVSETPVFSVRRARAIGACFFVYGFLAGVIVPDPLVNLLRFLTEERFFELVRLPVSVFRGAVVTLLGSLFVWSMTRSLFVSRTAAGLGRRFLFLLPVSFAFLYGIFLVAGWQLVQAVTDHENENMKRLVLRDAHLFSQAFAGSSDVDLSGLTQQSAYPVLRQAHSRLVDLAQKDSFAKALYLVRLQDATPVFLVGSQSQIFPSVVFPSFGRRVPTKQILDAFHAQRPTFVGPYMDQNGMISFTVFLPLERPEGSTPYLLGVDLDGRRIFVEIRRVRLYALFGVMSFLILLIVGYGFLILFAVKNTELEIQKGNLDKAIQHLRETEAELARSDETFRGILSNSPNAIFGFDRDLRLIFWNEGASRLYGYAKGEVLNEKNPLENRRMIELLGMESYERDVAGVFAGATLVREVAHKTKSGQAVDVALTAFPVQDPQGNILFGMGLVQDVSGHKRLEAELEQERDRLRIIAAHIGAGLCLIDRSYKIQWANEVMQGWFGSLESLQGRACFEAFHRRAGICKGCSTEQAFLTGVLSSAEQRVTYPDGRVLDFSIVSSPIKDEKGQTQQVLELVLDVTERRRIFELLEYERALSRNVIDSIGDPLLVISAETRTILDVNRVFLATSGLSRDQVLGRSIPDLPSHLCAACDVTEFDRVLATGLPVEATCVHRLPSGDMAYLDICLTPLKDEKGQIIGLIHIARDVTDRKRLEDELKKHTQTLEALVEERTRALQTSELMFRRLFESAQDGILIMDAEHGNIIDVNPYLLQLFEATRGDLQGRPFHEARLFFENPVLRAIPDELREAITVFHDSVVVTTQGGREISIEVRASWYFVENRRIIQWHLRDITERKKIEKIKSEFVSMVSHELRTPLSAIKEGVEIVADGTQGKLSRSQKECLDIALSNIRRLNRLIGDILDISKIQSNLLTVRVAPCDVAEAVDHVYHLAKIEIEKSGLVLVTDIEKDLPRVIADRDRLIQVLTNLLNNAVKFTREKSRINLTCRRVGAEIEFAVRDEGPGIPEEELSRLFGRFVQLDSTLVRRVGGTGLGLYISKNLVDAMGGHIWAESRAAGEGAVFKFTLPIEKT